MLQLVDVMLEENVPLFVCAVGVPPVWVVEKLHANGALVMNMAGLPKHVTKALDCGVDIICASGTEGGAHTGDVSTLGSFHSVQTCANVGLSLSGPGESTMGVAWAHAWRSVRKDAGLVPDF